MWAPGGRQINRFLLEMSLSKAGTSVKWVIGKSPVGAHLREFFLITINIFKNTSEQHSLNV